MKFRERFVKWIGAEPTIARETISDDEKAEHTTQDAVEIIIACERRLADDRTLARMCRRYLGEPLDGSTKSLWAIMSAWYSVGVMSSFSFTEYAPNTQAARDAVRKCLRDVELRIAEANLGKAKEAVKGARKAARD